MVTKLGSHQCNCSNISDSGGHSCWLPHGCAFSRGLFAELGKSLARAKLSWFTNEQRAQIKTIAGQGIPGFMSIPAHQLQTFYMRLLCLYF